MRYADLGWGTLKQVSLEASFLHSLRGASEYEEQDLPHLFDCGTLFVVVQSLGHVWLFATQWIAVRQASLSFPISWSLLIFMSIESVMLSNHLMLCHPFSFCLQSFPASGCFPVSRLFASGGKSIGPSALASVLPMNIQGWFTLGLTVLISLQCHY